jgi:multicomponent Na+:H+ antiporter subunit B
VSRSREGPVVAKTVRAVAPFVLTFGLFTVFHGTTSVGGGFQGGVLIASVSILLAFAFGVDQTRARLGRRRLLVAAAAGPALFGAIAAGSLALGGAFLDPTAYPVKPAYVVELIEVGIGVTVAAVVTALFFELAGEGEAADESGRAGVGRVDGAGDADAFDGAGDSGTADGTDVDRSDGTDVDRGGDR